MCGIAGIVGRPPEDRALIERMTAMLGHRGPDDSGVWRSPGAHLGHTRLSILDLSAAGHQPMLLDDLVLTYNGEIYNFHELREALSGPFVSDTDTEVVLHLFRERGARAVERFHGMFAFAIWDQKRERLFAARDRVGIKPLYYRPFEGGLAFASEIQPLLDLGPELGPPEIDLGALADYLLYGYIPTPKTSWQGIFKLGAAETLTWEAGRLEISRYWEPEPRIELTDMEAAADELDELLSRIVPEHSLSDVPIGVFLSGGLDSTSIAAYLEGPSTFTLGQPEKHRDEAPAARRVARHLGTEHREEVAEIPDLSAAVDTVVSVFGEPFGDSAALSVWLLSRFTSRHVKVALSGEGGDEVFCGYRWYGKAMSAPASALRRLVALGAPTFSATGRSSERRGAGGLERYASFVSLFTPKQQQAFLGARVRPHADEDPLWHLRRYWRPELAFHQRLQWADMHTYLPDDLLPKVDRASMAFSLEVRPPMLDHRLIEWALGLGPALQRDPETDRGKMVLRKLIEPKLPAGHLDLPKRGFNLGVRRQVRREPAVMKDAVARLEANDVIAKPRVFHLTNDQMWTLLVLDRWLVRNAPFYDRGPQPEHGPAEML